ncbi:TPM domain-containing protein [Leptospira bouyouniensis]|nr:TPM domain-containing protein [Leptospira bouyouniensis]
MKKLFLSISLFASILFLTNCREEATPEQFIPIRDEINLLSNKEKGELSELILNLKRKYGSEIAILIIETTKNKSIEEYSLEYFEKWKIGREFFNDGLLILLAIDDRKLRIEVGYGLEKIIKDEIAARIIKEKMIPRFKNGEFFPAIKIAVEDLIKLIENNPDLIGDQEGINSRWDKIKNHIKK